MPTLYGKNSDECIGAGHCSVEFAAINEIISKKSCVSSDGDEVFQEKFKKIVPSVKSCIFNTAKECFNKKDSDK